jgi:hypothetical protein
LHASLQVLGRLGFLCSFQSGRKISLCHIVVEKGGKVLDVQNDVTPTVSVRSAVAFCSRYAQAATAAAGAATAAVAAVAKPKPAASAAAAAKAIKPEPGATKPQQATAKPEPAAPKGKRPADESSQGAQQPPTKYPKLEGRVSRRSTAADLVTTSQ